MAMLLPMSYKLIKHNTSQSSHPQTQTCLRHGLHPPFFLFHNSSFSFLFLLSYPLLIPRLHSIVMRDTNVNKSHRQAFQAHASSDSPPLSKIPVDISARWDNKMNLHIILWTDIKHIFKNAAYILNDGVAVPFMTDDDFNE